MSEAPAARLLVVDVGTSSVRAAAVDAAARLVAEAARPLPPASPAQGLVELDPPAMAAAVLDAAREVLDATGPVAGVGVATQRASTLLWERRGGAAAGPGLGWQDLRTVGRCLALRAAGVRVAPNTSATKLEWLLDACDPERTRDLCFGTVDSWVVWVLTEGARHVTDGSNVALTGLRTVDNVGWAEAVLAELRVPTALLPEVVDSVGRVGVATALPGTPPITGILGDQQASLLGQGCVRPGDAKITFGTGAMLDVVVGPRPDFVERGGAGTFPVVTRRRDGRDEWGLEAAALAAGSAVDWLADDVGLVADPADSDRVARECDDAGDVWFVPALAGLGTPDWDHGARGTLLGLTRGTTRAQVVRAVLEGIAHTGADLVDAATTDAGIAIDTVRVDGGMSRNPTFVQALADATGRPVQLAPVVEATTLGAAFAAGLALGVWAGDDEIAATWAPRAEVAPRRTVDRARWRQAVERARRWVPALSGLDL